MEAKSTKSVIERLHDATLFKTQSYIEGVWVDAHAKATFSVNNPASQQVLAEVANLAAPAAETAIAAAHRAFPDWAAKTGKERAGILRNWFDLIMQNEQDLAKIMVAEQGKSMSEAIGEVAYAGSFIEWFAEEAKRVNGDILASPFAEKRLMTLKQPIGVCAAITPWNFPLAMITRKAGPALAAGCTIIIKPAEQTPLSALALAELAHRAGIPKGVLNVVTGDEQQSVEIGKTLCSSPIVRHLSFTGSTEVGRILMQQCAPTIKKLSLELGGLAPFIVFDDADVDSAIEGALISKYRNTGQTCISANRYYVHEKVYDQFVQGLARGASEIVVGDGMDTRTNIGPLIDDAAVAKVVDQIDDARSKGAKVVAGGRPHKLGGCFFEPSILADVTPDMKIMQEETFGPVAAVCMFQDEAEVIHQANNTHYGLAAYVYSKDVARVWRLCEALEFGMVGVNTSLFSADVAPFGGVKQSGLGREGSKYGIDEYVELKYVCLGDL